MIQPYPDGIDCAWLATDRKGQVAAFITGGSGPIPLEALRSQIPVEEIEERLCNLRQTSGTQVFDTLSRPDAFTDIAKRGIFVYDWADVHRTTRDASGVYEAAASPYTPICIREIPRDIADLAEAVKLNDLAFDEIRVVDIRSQTQCIESRS